MRKNLWIRLSYFVRRIESSQSPKASSIPNLHHLTPLITNPLRQHIQGITLS